MMWTDLVSVIRTVHEGLVAICEWNVWPSLTENGQRIKRADGPVVSEVYGHSGGRRLHVQRVDHPRPLQPHQHAEPLQLRHIALH